MWWIKHYEYELESQQIKEGKEIPKLKQICHLKVPRKWSK